MTAVKTHLDPDHARLTITLDRPKGNILTLDVMGELSAALAAHQEDPKLKLVVLRGAGGNFSFGASVEEHQAHLAAKMLQGFHALCRRIAHYPVPVAALVEGQCLGGAFEVVLCAHFVFVTPNAKLGCPEIKLGVFPPVLAALGAIRLGGALAERLILTGDVIDAETAVRSGFAAGILAEPDPAAELDRWFLGGLAQRSAHALRQATFAARDGAGVFTAIGPELSRIEGQYLERVVPSHDGNEGLKAFLERRAPKWEDR